MYHSKCNGKGIIAQSLHLSLGGTNSVQLVIDNKAKDIASHLTFSLDNSALFSLVVFAKLMYI